MKYLLCFLSAILCLSASAQTTQPMRNQFTTNNAMNAPSDGWISVWNNTAKKWSNVVNTATSTNLPAYLQTATLTNLAGTGLSAGATNASAYVGSSSGLGTNLDFFGTTEYLGGDVRFGGPARFTNTIYAYASLAVDDNFFAVGQALLLSNTIISDVTYYNTNANFTLVLSNAQNNTAHIFAGNGYGNGYPVTPSILNSNLAAGSMFQGAKLYNKTNITLVGQPGLTVIDGSSALGELLFISNCYNVTIKGFTFRGMTNHNINALPDYSAYLWAGVNLYASAHVKFEDCRFERHADHGLQDKGAEANSVGSSTIISTNNIQVINCYFTDIGGFRTNSGDGTIRGDGTAIVPTGWTMEGNVFQDCQRGIEPYDTADADGRLFYNTIIRNNKFYNMVEFAVSPAGSTNGHNVQVIGNTLINDPSFSYHGTNWGAGGIAAMCQGFMLNGGRGWVVKDNYAKGAMYIGYSMISSATLDDFTLEGNTADFIDRGDSLGYGFWIGNSVNSAANASSVRRLLMRGNKTYKTFDSGILVVAARDSVVDGNMVSTILRTNIGASSSAFQFGAASMSSSIITNLTIQNNVAINGNNDAAQPMDVAFGYYFAANLSNVKSINNHAYDFDIAAYTNLAGDNVRIENSISGDTNRVMRVRDLNGLLTQGANITLTPAADGSVTIAGGAGAGEANVNGEISVTNGTRIGLVYGKAGITNLLRSLEAGYGLGLTNRGTNIDVAITDSELIEWSGISTNRFATTNSAHIQFSSSNNVRVAAGANITVTPSGSGGVMTYTVAGSASGGTNLHSLNVSNHTSLTFTNVGTNAVQGFDLMGPSVADSFINGNTTWVITNMPAWTNLQGATVSSKYEINARYGSGTLTLASLHPIDFGDGGLFLATGATNTVVIQYINGRVVGSVSHRASTGSGPIVLQTNATIYQAQFPTNAFLRTGPGGIVTTGAVDGTTITMSASGVLSASGGEMALAMGEVRTFDGTNYISTNMGWALNYPPNLGYTRMVFKGDSLTLGTGGTPYPTVLTNLYLTTTNYIYATNAGVGGQTAATMNSNFATDILPHAPAGGTNGLLFLWGGINDIAAGTSATTIYSSLTNIYGKAKTNGDGWVIVAYTVTPSMTISAAQEFQRNVLNDLIRNSPWWDYLVDVARNVPAPPDSTWYSDYIHFGTDGYAAIARHTSETLQRGKRNLYTPHAIDTRKQFMGYGTVRGLSTAIYSSAALPGLMLENSSTSDVLSLLPISSGLVNIYYRVGSGSLAAADVHESMTALGHIFRRNTYVSTNSYATNSFILPTASISAPAGLTTAGAQMFSDGTNMLVVFQDAGGTRTTNKLTMTAWP